MKPNIGTHGYFAGQGNNVYIITTNRASLNSELSISVGAIVVPIHTVIRASLELMRIVDFSSCFYFTKDRDKYLILGIHSNRKS